MVEMMAAYKIPEDEMIKAIINPDSGEPISRTTLQKHFRKELDSGFVTGRMRIMAATFRSALGETETLQTSQGPVTKQTVPGNVTAQIWLQKVLYGLREKVDVGVPYADADSGDEGDVTIENARRVAFTFALGARAIKAKAK